MKFDVCLSFTVILHTKSEKFMLILIPQRDKPLLILYLFIVNRNNVGMLLIPGTGKGERGRGNGEGGTGKGERGRGNREGGTGKGGKEKGKRGKGDFVHTDRSKHLIIGHSFGCLRRNYEKYCGLFFA